eukprot:5414242-Prymnesium_polylepis.1
MSKLDMLLEMELGITGGEEDGVNNEARPHTLAAPARQSKRKQLDTALPPQSTRPPAARSPHQATHAPALAG